MKTRQRFVAILAAAFVLSGSFPVITGHAEQAPEDGIEAREEEIAEEIESEQTEEKADAEQENPEAHDEEAAKTSCPEMPEEEMPAGAPAFQARIEYWPTGYTVIGTFQDFTPDITLIQTLYSLDGKNWQADAEVYSCWGSGDVLRQPCIQQAREPLKSYIAGEIDRFYLKLRITRENGLSCETQTAVIDRGGLQVLPEGTQSMARFSSDILVNEPIPGTPLRFRSYAGYQLTVPADATAESLTALLPETLPVEVQFYIDTGANLIAIGVIDCPVTWKPLSLPRLTPGETVTIAEAAEEITVPAGTRVSTPLGIFELKENLSLDNPPYTDEVRLTLNVKPESKNPTGVLAAERDALKIALYQKPTGATSIKAYILTEGESAWTELSGLSLCEEFSQPSTENSGYALLLRDDQEPYRSYLAAKRAGETPVPFFVGLKIEGGVFDGGELILSWPDVYDRLPDLPKIKGVQGNEGNAGANNKEDSTDSGQRPSLPQVRNDGQEGQPQDSGTDSTQEKQTLPVSVQETGSEMPEDPDPSSSDESVSRDPSAGQRPDLPRIASDFSDTDQGSTPKLVPPVVQAAADTEKEETALSDPKTAAAQTVKNGSRIPLFPVTVVLAAGGCIGAALSRMERYGFLRRLAESLFKIRRR